MTKTNLNIKAAASAFAALALTMVLSWAFVDATSTVALTRDSGFGFLSSIASLVR
jgi:hypothetical protein